MYEYIYNHTHVHTQKSRFNPLCVFQVVEFDSPDVLRQKPDSLFSSLLAAANTINA